MKILPKTMRSVGYDLDETGRIARLTIRKKISHRLFSTLFLVAVIPICIMGYGMYREAEKILIHNAFLQMRTSAQDHASRLDTWFEERLNDVRVLSELSIVQDYCNDVCSTVRIGITPSAQAKLLESSLALTRGKSPSYESIHILTLSGGILASTEPDSEMLADSKYMEDLKTLKQSGGSLFTPVHQHSDERWYMHIWAPIVRPGGEMIAAILAILDASGTLDPIMTTRVGLGVTGEAYLVNEAGKIITVSKYLGRSELKDRSFDTFAIRAALAHEVGVAIYQNYMGREVVGSYLWLPRYHWALLVEMEKAEILAPLFGVRVAVVTTTGLVSLLCVIASFVMSRRISRPIIQMAQVSAEIAKGHLDQRTTYTGPDEIGVLSESFNSMAERLSVLIDSLRRKETSLQKAYNELIQTQEQLVQSEKMAAVGELVTSVVHEMRNPLSSVKLNFQIIGRTLSQDSSLLEHYRIGLDQISQLERMFSSLLDYSKPLALDVRTFRLEEIIEQSLRQLESVISEQSVRIKSLDGTLPPVTGDPEKIRQVMVNIIQNAIEAAGPHGRVEISARVEDRQGRPLVIVEVLDNGPGLSAQDLKRIFQPFFTTKKKGTGLGLSIVRKIMDAHRFEISVASEEGYGTVVSLHFQGA